VKFGLIYELSVPRPFGGGAEHKVFHDALAQVRLADELGFDQVWAVEHHFLEGYSHSSSPEIFLTACAMLTQNMRVGHGIAVCVPEFNNPIKLAERTATMDILSNGRVDLGTGRSSTWTELGGFGADLDETKKTWDEYLRVISGMWTQERFSYQGRSFSMPERAVLPKPIQTPHPPVWVAVTSPGTEVEAAERGLGCLGLSVTSPLADQERRIALYRRVIQNCEPATAFVNDQVNMVSFMFCHEDNDHALATGDRFARTFTYAASQLLEVKESYPTNAYFRPGLLSGIREGGAAGAAKAKKTRPDGLVFGDPDAIIDVVRRWEATGTDRLVFMLNCMDSISHDEVMASLRLFASEVMPHFQEPVAERPLTSAVVA
jgi:alkanesulfonate monooxygenase SsuD/methylene tetrahydromethanopterin reductase-like flavin-dependent oxidoreductase (luciferase family)